MKPFKPHVWLSYTLDADDVQHYKIHCMVSIPFEAMPPARNTITAYNHNDLYTALDVFVVGIPENPTTYIPVFFESAPFQKLHANHEKIKVFVYDNENRAEALGTTVVVYEDAEEDGSGGGNG